MEKKEFRPVKTLSQETARKIAAGEVIDRPSAIIRELLDNAADSGATQIQTEIENGGIDRIRVADNGCGMTKDDLENCAKPHATSKIENEVDLLSLNTLGFRGEALASIAAVSRLEITSIREENAWKLEASISQNHRISPASLACGTVVQSSGLFENFPARRVFLKRPASEALTCKHIFVEKALPLPQTAFRFSVDGKIKLDLPANQTHIERFVSALELKEPVSHFYEIDFSNDSAGFSFLCVLGGTSVYKSDKKSIFVYINGRRIWEYSLVQAIEYGSQGYFPNGTFPVACVFVRMNPALVDFNIHPAKKEARFKDISVLHHALSSQVRNFYKNQSASLLAAQVSALNTPNTNSFFEQKTVTYSPPQKDFSFATSEKKQTYSAYSQSSYSPKKFYNEMQTDSFYDFMYLGQALGVFLIAEKNNTLYLIDQHAAQERLLYESFLSSIGKKQPLLFAYVIETQQHTDDDYLQSIRQELLKAGFTLTNKGGGRWEVSTVSAQWSGTEEDLMQDLLTKRVKPNELCATLAATYACRAAVKDGIILDDEAAKKLIAQTFDLKDPHCPHGRPIWTTLTKTELFKLVRRI